MPDILAIVSKAVFESEAGALGVGELWETKAYTSTNKALAPASSGSLFLVTVRPNMELWLVAILDKPKASKGAWRAAMNTVPITDVTASISQIRFASGKGLVRDAKLGMSLQTPREISEETAALLRGVRPAAKSAAVTSAMAATPVNVPGDAHWDPITDVWEHGATDDNGARQGLWRSWRPDGTLRAECMYRDHEPHGINRRFHPDGSVASEGEWSAGMVYGVTLYGATSTDETPLPANIARAVYRSRDGRTNETIEYYDADGRPVDHVGVRVPPRPASVAPTARFFSDHDFNAPDGSIGGWVDGRIERGTDKKIGAWRWWSITGALLHEERYTERGRRIEIDRIDATVERFCAGDAAPPKPGDEDREPHMRAWSRRYDLGKVFCDEVHAMVRPRLATLPAEITREYIGVLYEQVEEYGRGWSMKVAQHRAIVDVVDDWEARTPNAADANAWFLLAAGTRSALALGDRGRVERWWKRFAKAAKPKAKEYDTSGLVEDLAGELAQLRPAITTFLAKPKPLTHKATDAQLAKAAAAQFGGEHFECLVRDRKTGEAWLHAGDRSVYFDGKHLATSDVVFDDRSRHDHVYVAPYDTCDERIVLWPGKHGWLVLQRYGRAVLWHQAKYEVSRGQPEVDRLLWFKAPNPAYAKRLMSLIRAASTGRPIDPWCDAKLGVIVRRYSGSGTTALGVRDNRLTTGTRVIETLASHDEAVRAFEAIEIERLRNGSYIERFRAHDDVEH